MAEEQKGVKVFFTAKLSLVTSIYIWFSIASFQDHMEGRVSEASAETSVNKVCLQASKYVKRDKSLVSRKRLDVFLP